MSSPTKPCKGCPYSRATAPGDLRGNSPRRFLGQAIGPFLLPCHVQADVDGVWSSLERPQCSGAAKFRAQLGVEGRMPRGILRQPPDLEQVFASPAAYLAHHEGRTLAEAEAELRAEPIEAMCRREMAHPGLRFPTPAKPSPGPS